MRTCEEKMASQRKP